MQFIFKNARVSVVNKPKTAKFCRNRPKLKSIYLFVDNTVMPATAQLLSALYEEHKDQDGFLYITYAGESTFGGMN